MVKNRYKYLLKNTGLLFVSNFASKFLVFLLVPLYTNYLSTAEYGVYDLFYTTIQLLFPVVCLNVIDGVMRFSINENKLNQAKVFTITMKYFVVSEVTTITIYYILYTTGFIGDYTKYTLGFFILFTAYILNNFITQFARGIDDIKGISIAGVVSTVVMLMTNILVLVVLKLGLSGYFTAMALSLFIPAAYLFFRNKMWRFYTSDIKFFELSQFEKDMLAYCMPLIFISLSWYINNVSDRYVVTLMAGIDANGLYSVSYKIPAILNALQVVFIQAWQLSAIKEYDSKEGSEFISKTYNICSSGMVLMCSVLIIFTKPIAHLLFAKDFYAAWQYVPVLLLYIVFNSLSGTVGGVFSAAKKSKVLALSAIVGGTANVVLNFLLVYLFGVIGAAVATVISSIIIWGMRMKESRKIMMLDISLRRQILQYLLLMFQAVSYVYVENFYISVFLQLALFASVMMLSKTEINVLINGLKGMLKK